MAKSATKSKTGANGRYPRKVYERELLRLQGELVKMSYWLRSAGTRVVVLFEGRDAAGKGGTIKRITEFLSPRIARVAALPPPTGREQSQWYFQRYISHLPAAGEMLLLDRSWYNRAGVETVMGFCTPEERRVFLQQCPQFERQLVDDDIILIKYWLSISDAEQARRFQARVNDPKRRWKLSPMDLNARARFIDYSRAKDEMFVHTDTSWAPWYVVEADDKRKARLNCIAHLLSRIPYEDTTPEPIKIPKRQPDQGYVRPPRDIYTYVPDHAQAILTDERNA
jgi:polyphosphate kinase 2